MMKSSIDSILEEIQNVRKNLHTFPELSYKEYNTTKLIENTIKSWGLVFNRFNNLETGGYCDVGEGEIIAFRSDIDALPITEDPSHNIISSNVGVMHACGHDYHAAIGLGLLRYFSKNANRLKIKLRVIFQPAEEAAPGGAEFVLKENVLENAHAAFAIHVDPTLEVGKFNILEGPVQASTTSIKIELIGSGGHTSKPSETVDLINVVSFYIVQIQNHLKQKIDPRETVAFAFGAINGGSTHNTIPQEVSIRGTIRTHNNNVLDNCLGLMKTFTASFAELNGININLQFPTNCPATINDINLTNKFVDFMENTGRHNDLILNSKPSMGADDFAFYGLDIPGLYIQVGAAGSGTLHGKDLIINEDVLKCSLEPMIVFFTHF
jgi:amidohydrolase